MEYLQYLGAAGVGGFLVFVVDRVIEIYRLQFNVKESKFRNKVETYTDWLTTSSEVEDQLCDSSYMQESAQDPDSYADFFRLRRNKLKQIGHKLTLYLPKSDRSHAKVKLGEYFTLYKDLLQKLWELRNVVNEQGLGNEIHTVLQKNFDQQVAIKKKLVKKNDSIKKLLYRDVSL